MEGFGELPTHLMSQETIPKVVLLQTEPNWRSRGFFLRSLC